MNQTVRRASELEFTYLYDLGIYMDSVPIRAGWAQGRSSDLYPG